MEAAPFVVEVPSERFFRDDHCANCLALLPDDIEALFCSSWCAEITESVRYQRRVFRDGRIDDPDVKYAVQIRNAFLLAGGYRALGRTLPASTRAEVKVRDGGRCRACGSAGVEIDHVAGSSADPSNLQLLCANCHKAKTSQNLVPATPEQTALLMSLFVHRVLPDFPRLLADDESAWAGAWRGLKASRRKRFFDRAIDEGVDVGRFKSRAEVALELLRKTRRSVG